MNSVTRGYAGLWLAASCLAWGVGWPQDRLQQWVWYAGALGGVLLVPTAATAPWWLTGLAVAAGLSWACHGCQADVAVVTNLVLAALVFPRWRAVVDWPTLRRWLVIIGCVHLTVMLLQWVGQDWWFNQPARQPPNGLTPLSPYAGLWMAWLVILSWPRWPWLAGVAVVACAAAQSVAAWGALTLWLGWRVWRSRPAWRGYVVAVLLGVLVGLVVRAPAWWRIKATMRWDWWTAAGRLWADHALVGIGPGNFPRVAAQLLPAYAEGASPGWVTLHSTPLQWLVEVGLLGLVPCWWWRWWQRRWTEETTTVVGLIGTLAVVGVGHNVDRVACLAVPALVLLVAYEQTTEET